MVWPTDVVTLWHGTDDVAAASIINNGARVSTHRQGKATKTWDFGPGFYTTTRRSAAVSWASQTALLAGRSGTPMLVRYEVQILDFVDAAKMAFGEGGATNELYWGLVSSCRSGVLWHNAVKGFDFPIVIGPVCASVAPNRGGRNLVPDMYQISFHARKGTKCSGIEFINRHQAMMENP